MNYIKVDASYVTAMRVYDGVTTPILFNICNIASVQPTRNGTPRCIVSCTDGEHYMLNETYDDFVNRTFRKNF